MWFVTGAVLLTLGLLYLAGAPVGTLILTALAYPVLLRLSGEWVFFQPPSPMTSPAPTETPETEPPQPWVPQKEAVARFDEWWPEPSPPTGERTENGTSPVNAIVAVAVDQNYVYPIVNLRIDDEWLDERLDRLHPGLHLKGLIPVMNYHYMEERSVDEARAVTHEKMRFIARRILPLEGETSITPLLACPDCDFLDCDLVVAEVTNAGPVVRWQRLGLDRSCSWVEAESSEPIRPSEARILGDIFEGTSENRVRVLRLTGSWSEVGTNVDWLSGGGLTFEKNDYLRMLASFREQYERASQTTDPGM